MPAWLQSTETSSEIGVHSSRCTAAARTMWKIWFLESGATSAASFAAPTTIVEADGAPSAGFGGIDEHHLRGTGLPADAARLFNLNRRAAGLTIDTHPARAAVGSVDNIIKGKSSNDVLQESHLNRLE